MFRTFCGISLLTVPLLAGVIGAMSIIMLGSEDQTALLLSILTGAAGGLVYAFALAWEEHHPTVAKT